jgi:hypothetical protein
MIHSEKREGRQWSFFVSSLPFSDFLSSFGDRGRGRGRKRLLLVVEKEQWHMGGNCQKTMICEISFLQFWGIFFGFEYSDIPPTP